MAKVYLLSWYEEHGSYDMVASTSKETITNLIDSDGFLAKFRPDRSTWKGTEERFKEVELLREADAQEAREKLSKLLAADEPSVYGIDLMRGWGGIQLHIVELQ